MSIKVFVSAGTPANDAQRIFRDAVVNAIKLAGFTPRLMDSRDWDYRNPLRGVTRAMSECHGVVVVAYARFQIDSGAELREGGGRPLESIAFPTAWNQIEAAMAYEKGLPLLVVAEKRLRREALLDSGNDVKPYWTDLDPTIGYSDGFQGYLRSWKEDVELVARKPPEPDSPVTFGQLLKLLPWYELLAIIVTLISSLIGAVSVGYRLGTGQWPLG